MEIDGNKFPAEKCRFECKICDFNCSKKSNWIQHIKTKKHVYRHNGNNLETSGNKKCCLCEICGKKYLTNSGLWKHMQGKCGKLLNEKKQVVNENLVMMLIKENTDFKNNIFEQQNKMIENQNMVIELCKNSFNINNIHNTNNSHNKTFNLNVFLNETCKNAMNISDFANSIQIQLSDLENVGELGYVNGISNIIIKNLKELDITQRPIHCTDAKREILYVKHDDKWEKEGEQKDKIIKFVKNIANKNIKMLIEFKNKYPDCVKRESRHSDHYNKLIIEAMGGSGNNDEEQHEKIIKKISKEVTIDKELL
jgi:hypothetical protein